MLIKIWKNTWLFYLKVVCFQMIYKQTLETRQVLYYRISYITIQFTYCTVPWKQCIIQYSIGQCSNLQKINPFHITYLWLKESPLPFPPSPPPSPFPPCPPQPPPTPLHPPPPVDTILLKLSSRIQYVSNSFNKMLVHDTIIKWWHPGQAINYYRCRACVCRHIKYKE